MELVVFDLDGTLLNNQAKISPFTRDTLQRMTQKGIAYTVATGRTFHSASTIIAGHNFVLPHIYNNGVLIWHPDTERFSLDNCLSLEVAHTVVNSIHCEHATPFISATNDEQQHFVFHPELRNEVEKNLLTNFKERRNIHVLPIADMPDNLHITNISMIGPAIEVDETQQYINTQQHLVAYSGPAVEGQNYKWIDIHHRQANKGSAIQQLCEQLNSTRVICFGDSDNDISMFAAADESYAPENAKEAVKAAANDVIGHHNEDSVAKFLRQRFDL